MGIPERPDLGRTRELLRNSRELLRRSRELLGTWGDITPVTYETIKTPRGFVTDNLERLTNPYGDYGLPSIHEQMAAVTETAKQGKTAVHAVVGPAGAGKTRLIIEMLEKYTAELPEALGRQPKIAVIPTETIYTEAKKFWLINPEHIHGGYTAKEYKRANKYILNAAHAAVAEGYDIVLLDTPSTTGALYTKRDGTQGTYGKDRGTTALRKLAEGQAEESGYDFFVTAVVPGPYKEIRSIHRRRTIDYLRDRLHVPPEKMVRVLAKHGIHTDVENVALIMGASAAGTEMINSELVELVLRFGEVDDINFVGLDRQRLAEGRLPRPRYIFGNMLAQSIYPRMFRDFLGVPSNHAYIGLNEERQIDLGSMIHIPYNLFDEHNYVKQLVNQGRAREVFGGKGSNSTGVPA